MRGLPSRDWRTTSTANYGATQHVPVTWKEKLLVSLGWCAEQVGKLFRLLGRWWSWAWNWSMSLPTRPKRLLSSCALLVMTFLFVLGLFMRGYNWLVYDDPCGVAVREKVAVIEEEESDGVFTQLPKIVHWDAPWENGDNIPPGKLLEWNTEFRRLFPEPEYRHVLWTRCKVRKLIQDKYSWFLDELERSNTAEITCSRVFVLNEEGGLFANLDYQVSENFWDSLPKNRPAIAESPFKYKEDFQGMLISSPPAHPFWNLTIDLLKSKLATNGGGWYTSGTISCNALLNDAVRKARRTSLGPNAVYSLPCENFNRLALGEYSEYLPFYTRWSRTLLSSTFLMKQCGSIESGKCLYGMYHDSAATYLSAHERTIVNG